MKDVDDNLDDGRDNLDDCDGNFDDGGDNVDGV